MKGGGKASGGSARWSGEFCGNYIWFRRWTPHFGGVAPSGEQGAVSETSSPHQVLHVFCLTSSSISHFLFALILCLSCTEFILRVSLSVSFFSSTLRTLHQHLLDYCCKDVSTIPLFELERETL